MKILEKNEEHLGGVLCYTCKYWLIFGRVDIVPFKTTVYRTFDPYDPSGEGEYVETEYPTVICSKCSKRINVHVF